MNRKWTGLFLGLLALLVMPFLSLEGLSFSGHVALGIFSMAAIFWIFEPIPIHATSMAVILSQVLLLSDQSVISGRLKLLHPEGYTAPAFTQFYGTLANPIIILFLGGFALAAAAEKYKLDRNLTRVLLKPFGTRPVMVSLGVMVVTAILSAFMSNTATTAMMMTVAIPIVAAVSRDDPFRRLIGLSIPVGANIGGIATPIGTPPNAVALAALARQGVIVPFSTWMMLATPLVVVTLLLSWWGMCRIFPPRIERFELRIDSTFDRSPRAIAAYTVFIVTVLLWITEKLHGIPSGVVAFLPLVLLPAMGVLEKKDIRGFSWEVLWLVAGGISLGLSLQQTGLAVWMVGQVSWEGFSTTGLVVLFSLVGFLVANLVSHTVSATILMPIAISLVLPLAGGVSAALVIPIAAIGIIVSYANILPISTPPNAIALSTGLIESRDLATSGILVGALGFIFTILFGLVLWPILL
ncbi:MAG: DASS family sodium-coupled anion symporter [Spirochaetaceae bacterium]|nr:MAG: DASS family sodium-coupled anion symporter [Spirochaetaceae bacterium]